MPVTLDNHNQFVTTEGKQLGVYLFSKGTRFQFRTASGILLASGMTPAEFVKRFWHRDDYGG